MARSEYGGGPSDWLMGTYRFAGRDLPTLESGTLTFYDAETAGTQHTDLLLDGEPVTAITVGDDGQIPVFSGPDGVTEMWADAGSTRVKLTAGGGVRSYLDLTDKPTIPVTAVDVGADPAGTADAAIAPVVAALEDKVERDEVGGQGPLMLDIPTPDGNPSAAHPSVLHFPQGWNGWRYWMAYTPYPTESRENPCIVVSNDGVTWQEPDGISNPVAPLADVTPQGYTFQSDGDIVMSPDGATMLLYYRAYMGVGSPTPGAEGIYLRTSTDGVTWSAGTRLFTDTASTSEVMSPSLVVEDDGTFTMWVVRESVEGAGRITRRTSPDGSTWSAPTGITVTDNYDSQPQAWHLTVRKYDGRYYMLMTSRMPYRLYWLSSGDGLAWTFNPRALPRSGTSFDDFGNYRSTFTLAPGKPVRFDVWATGISPANPTSMWTVPWRISLMRGVDPNVGGRALSEQSVSVVAAQMVASPFGAPAGVAVLKSAGVSARFQCQLFNDGANGAAIGTVLKPAGFSRFKVVVYWINNGAGAGNVRFDVGVQGIGDDNSSRAGDKPLSVTVAAKAQDQLNVSTIGYVDVGASDDIMHVRAGRTGTHGEDTLTTQIGIAMVRLVPVI